MNCHQLLRKLPFIEIPMMKESKRKQAAKLEKKRKLAKKREKVVSELPIPENLNRLNSCTYNEIDTSIVSLRTFKKVQEETGKYDVNVFAKKMLRVLKKEHPSWNDGARYEVIGKEWKSAAKFQMQRMRGL
ncbi:hypothetical protein Anas_11952 [Armadillidium nasatum]|uniref:Uncharacterized protein n=1 Tax=Armadillidium nasatum TaxID=96803 RepID=A0A5N5T7D6_9CRUS|nr:hypothetical protein Anas_11952 [Armadillidium nasatum]